MSRPGALEGIPPEKFSFSKRRDARNKLGALLNTLVEKEKIYPQSIVVLSNRVLERSFLAGDARCGAFVLKKAGSDDLKDNEIPYRTVQGFKGLESDLVIYLDHVGISRTEYDKVNKYVAATRARFLLYVIEYQELN